MKRALLLPYRYLGDALLAVPLARSLRQAGYRVEWLVHDGAQSLFEAQPFADEVHVLRSKGSWSLGRSLWRNYALAFVVNGTDRLTALGRIAGRRVYATLTEDRFADAWKRWCCTDWQPFTPDTHTLCYVNGLARLAGLEENWHAALQWSRQDEILALNACRVSAGGYALLHPFSRLRYKHWPDACWRQLIRRLLAHGLDVLITGSAADRQAAEACFASLDAGGGAGRVRLCCGERNWRELSALAARAAVYVGVDTVNTHLAAGSGARVVALFGPTNPCLWGPWPRGMRVRQPWRRYVEGGVQRQGNICLLQGLARACIPCQREGCEGKAERSLCLEEMEVDRVWSACRESMDG